MIFTWLSISNTNLETLENRITQAAVGNSVWLSFKAKTSSSLTVNLKDMGR